MKSLAVFIMLFLCSNAFLIFMDVLSGIPLSEAVRIILHSFTVITFHEKIIVFAAFVFPFAMPLISIMNKKKKAKTN